MSPFAQFLRQAQILILEISNIFLWLIPIESGSPSLNLNKIEYSAKVSPYQQKENRFVPDQLWLLLFKVGISAVELFYSSSGIHYFLFSGKEGVTLGAYLNFDIAFGVFFLRHFYKDLPYLCELDRITDKV